jgi:hypothetical protein
MHEAGGTVTRTRVLVALFVAVVAAVALAGPGHLAGLAVIIAVAFLGVVLLGMVHGLREGMARAGEEAEPEPPPAPGTRSGSPP